MRFSKIQPWQFYFFVGIYRVGKGGCHHSETWELIDPSKIGPQRFFRICYNPCPLNKTSQKQKDVDYRYFKPPKPAVWKNQRGRSSQTMLIWHLEPRKLPWWVLLEAASPQKAHAMRWPSRLKGLKTTTKLAPVRFLHLPAGVCCWSIIRFSKWLSTTVGKSSNKSCGTLSTWPFHGL